MPLDPDDSRPSYVQIADDLRESIRRGDIEPGAQLPSTAELTERYRVARMTVRSALRVLHEEGLLVARQGSGVFVRSTVDLGEPGTPEPSPRAIIERLDAMAGDLRTLVARVDELEKAVRPRERKSGTARG